jgi:hypothetical protein
MRHTALNCIDTAIDNILRGLVLIEIGLRIGFQFRSSFGIEGKHCPLCVTQYSQGKWLGTKARANFT